jgi:hypothetical protein
LQKVNPELLFWQRVHGVAAPKVNMPGGNSRPEHMPQQPQATSNERHGPRPPSYISDDGVSYVVGAQPRSTIYIQRPPDQRHPAYHH